MKDFFLKDIRVRLLWFFAGVVAGVVFQPQWIAIGG